MLTDLSLNQATATNEKLQLFSLYVDFPASISARWAANTIGRLAGPLWQTTTEMWKMESILSGRSIREMATTEAANADVLIIAASSLTQRDPALIEWLDALATWKTDRSISGLLVGLLGDGETETTELDWVVKPLIGCAQQTGRDFAWHWMGENAISDTDWLIENIENLLARKLAVRHEVVL